MAYQIDLSQSKFIVDDTPQLKREPPAIFAKKESTDYFDGNSTVCECNEEIEPYAFQLRFKVELKQDPIAQTQEEKELCNMGSSFGVYDGDKNNNFDNPIDHVNQNTQDPKDNHQNLGESKQSFNHIQKRNVFVQTKKLLLKNQQQLFKCNQKYVNHAVYQETLLSLKQKQSLQKFVSKKNNKNRLLNLLIPLILFIILIMCL